MSHAAVERAPRAARRARGSLVVLSACAALACAASPIAPNLTGLTVLVERGPIQPVSQSGQPNTAPVQGARVEVAGTAGVPTVQASTDSAGRVDLSLPVGSYTVSVLTCPGAIALPAPDTTAVTAGRFTTVSLECDTGIR